METIKNNIIDIIIVCVLAVALFIALYMQQSDMANMIIGILGGYLGAKKVGKNGY